MRSRQPSMLGNACMTNRVWRKRRLPHAIVALLVALYLLIPIGCATNKHRFQAVLDRSASKRSFLSWNLRSFIGTPREAKQSRAFQIASLSNRELDQLMRNRPAPDLDTLAGKWYGINKGFGSALIGLTQDIKVLENNGCVTGYNISVKQVAIRDLPCRGWRPQRDPRTCQPKTMGNFIAVAPCSSCRLGRPVKFDYTIAENNWYDPSRFLIDEIVAIDEDLLLGRATAKLGSMQFPVAYFVLMRGPQCECHSTPATSPTSAEQQADKQADTQAPEENAINAQVDKQLPS